MAKKYRCPCCGEESISLKKKIFHFAARGTATGTFGGNSCPQCGEKFKPVTRYSGIFNIGYQVLLYLFGALSLLGLLMYTTLFLWLFVSYCFLLVFIVFPLHNYLFSAIAPLKQKIYGDNIFEANAIVEISSAVKRMENLDIYGLQFMETTKNKRFIELFPEGLVPIVIHKMKKKQKSPFHVMIMKAEFIPSELLHAGAQFTLVDNGIDIAMGTVVKLLKTGNKT